MFPQLFGKYVLEREIAAGGMARVYLATLRGAVGFEKRVVVKQIRPELASDDAFVRRFVEEAKTAVELGHPNIVPVYELGVEHGVYYIAMEFCEGVTLSEVLTETGPLSPEEGAYLGIELCRALDYAHRRASIVHRDVTPRNVMLDEEGAVRVIDFGIAAPVTLPEEGGVKKGELFGSPGHMPPEQIAGAALTPATDVFAAAVLLIEAWSGKPPFRRSTPAECLKALESKPPRLDAAKPELEPLAELIESAIAADPAKRPQTAEALARPLREFVKSADLGDVARRIGTRVRKTRRKLLASSPWLLGEGLTGAVDEKSEGTKPVEPRAPSIGDTQTFAVRNDIVEWTRKLPSVPPPRDEVVVETPAAPAVETRPLARDLEEPAESQNDPAPATDGGDRPSVSSRAQRPLVSLALVGAVAAAIWWTTRTPERPLPVDPTSTPLAASDREKPPVPPSAPSSEPKSVPSSSALPVTSGERPPLRPPVVPSAPATSDAGNVDPTGRATLSLTASPPSVASVGGRSYNTPASGILLAPGSYFVSFENGTLGLRSGAQVTLSAGAKRSVHVDFTDPAGPKVVVR